MFVFDFDERRGAKDAETQNDFNMKITRLKLINTTLDNFVNFIVQHHDFWYESHSSKMTVLINQVSDFDDKYDTQVLIARDMETEIHVDLVSNPMDFSTFEIFKNHEPRLSKKVKWALETYGKKEGILFEEIDVN